MLNIQGFQKTTLLDYPQHLAATIFFGGCNFRCPFCHNKDLVLSPEKAPAFSPEDVLAHLKKRRHILDGVCITGGEPTLQPDLMPFLHSIKELGLKVKLDTNGYRPDMLKEFCQAGLIDYVAMDIKGAPDSYAKICGLSAIDVSRIKASAEFLLTGAVEYEFRTTVVKELHKKEDFQIIGCWLLDAKAYYLQSYEDSPSVISPGFSAYTLEELQELLKLLQEAIPLAKIRGVEGAKR